MGKLAILKKIGQVGLQVAGLQAGGGSDKVRALEAEKELLELKLQLAIAELDEERAWLENRAEIAQRNGLELGFGNRTADIDDTLRAVRGHS